MDDAGHPRTRRRPRHRFARVATQASGLLMAVAIGFVMAEDARASPGWLAPEPLTPDAVIDRYPHTPRPQVAFDQRQNALVLWASSDGTHTIVRSASRSAASHSWQPAEALTAPGADADEPRLAVDGAGNAFAAWTRSAGGHVVVEAAIRPAATGRWLASQAISAPDADATGLQIAVNPRGDAIALWMRASNAGPIVQAAVRSTTAGAWSAPQTLSAPGGERPQVAIDESGNALAVWGGAQVRSAARPAGSGVWQAPQLVSTSPGADPALAIDRDGNAVVVWDAGSAVQSALRSAFVGMWQASETIAPIINSNRDSSEPRVAFRPDGVIVALWCPGTLEGAVRIPGSGWEPAATIAGSFSIRADLAVDARGNDLAVWMRVLPRSPFHIESSARPKPLTVWPAPQRISASRPDREPDLPDLAMDAEGNAIAIWADGESVSAAGYDGAGPRLDALAIPSEAVAGSAVSFSVAPVDAWSAVASTRWEFGDGESAAGDVVSHAFAAAGTYVVTATADDALGNRTSASRSLRVTAPPSPTQVLTTVIEPPTISVTALEPDRDHDGTPDRLDRCPDQDARTRDEDRNGCLDYARLRPIFTLKPGIYVGRDPRRPLGIVIKRLTVSELPRGARVTLTCTRRACGRAVLVVPRTGRVELRTLRGRRLRAGVRITVRATLKSAVGGGATYRVLRNDYRFDRFCIHPFRGRSCVTRR